MNEETYTTQPAAETGASAMPPRGAAETFAARPAPLLPAEELAATVTRQKDVAA